MWWTSRLEGNEPIGLLAGVGEFPFLFAKAANGLEKKLILFGIKGYTDRKIESFVSKAHYVDLGSVSELIDLLKESKIKKIVLAGSVPKRELYNPGFQLDDAAGGIIQGQKNRGDDHLLRAFCIYLKAKCGITVLDSRLFLKEAIAIKDVLTKRKPEKSEWNDLKLGYRVAKQIGRLDVGQTVVVKNGSVLAVEAIEGTDEAIQRGAFLGRGGVVVVKVSKPNQDLRFDLPCVGLHTLESMRVGASKVLGLEAGKTLILSKSEVIQRADEAGISIVGL